MGKGGEGSSEGQDYKFMYLGVVFIAGFCEFWSAIAVCVNRDSYFNRNKGGHTYKCEDEEAWAVAFGAISCVLVITTVIVGRFCSNAIVEQVIAVILFLGWFCVMAVCTMQQPFAPTGGGGGTPLRRDIQNGKNFGSGHDGNGYYGTWISLAASIPYMLEAVPTIKSLYSQAEGAATTSKQLLMVVAFASIIEMWHAARICDEHDTCEGMLMWGWIAGAVGGLVALIFALVPPAAPFIKYGSIFLTIWWVCAVLSLTMPGSRNVADCGKDTYCNGLFLYSSNGFFGAWVALIASSAVFGLTAGGVFSCIGVGGGSRTTSSTTTTTTTEHHTTTMETHQDKPTWVKT